MSLFKGIPVVRDPQVGFKEWIEALEGFDPDKTKPTPCGGCTECCRSSAQIPMLSSDKPLKHTKIARTGVYKGRRVLKKTRAGECYYVTAGGCSIYRERPLVCRLYDCRAAAFLFKVVLTDEPLDRVITSWDVRSAVRDDKDALYLLAYILAAQNSGFEGDDFQLATYAVSNYRRFIGDALRELEAGVAQGRDFREQLFRLFAPAMILNAQPRGLFNEHRQSRLP